MRDHTHQASPQGLAKHNNTHDEYKEVRDGIRGERLGISVEDESRINQSAIDINDGRGEAVAPEAFQADLQKQQQLLPGPVVRWERILPVRSLKILLVESDDSTRHVVSALLRNCSYEGNHLNFIS